MRRYFDDPSASVVCYPRSCNVVAFRLGRDDLRTYRSKDIEELRRQDALPEDQRADGYDALVKHVDAYHEAIDERVKVIQERRREELRQRGMDGLLEAVKADRVELICTEHYIHTYNMWQWYTCTYKPKTKGTPNERVWGDINHMANDAPAEVIGVIRATFDELDRGMIQDRRAKNS